MWQFGIVIFVCLTGCLPWQKAALDDPRYNRYLSWHSSTMPLKRVPKLFKLISSKAQKLFKKYLDPKPEKRPAGLAEVHRYVEDRWLSKVGIEKNNETQPEEDGLCPSMYSFHSSPEEKNKLLHSLTQYGLETTVDRTAKKDRIRQWIQASIIEEEDEGEEEDMNSEDDLHFRDSHANPIGERGPVERRIKNNHVHHHHHSKRHSRRSSTISLRKSPEIYRPPIDPRLPFEEQKNKSLLKLNEIDKLTTNGNVKQNGSVINVNSADVCMTKVNGIQTVLPLQSLSLNNIATSTQLQHTINVQMPQSGNVINVRGKTEKRMQSTVSTIRHDDKIFAAYNTFTKGGSSSSNSNSTVNNV